MHMAMSAKKKVYGKGHGFEISEHRYVPKLPGDVKKLTSGHAKLLQHLNGEELHDALMYADYNSLPGDFKGSLKQQQREYLFKRADKKEIKEAGELQQRLERLLNDHPSIRDDPAYSVMTYETKQALAQALEKRPVKGLELKDVWLDIRGILKDKREAK